MSTRFHPNIAGRCQFLLNVGGLLSSSLGCNNLALQSGLLLIILVSAETTVYQILNSSLNNAFAASSASVGVNTEHRTTYSSDKQ